MIDQIRQNVSLLSVFFVIALANLNVATAVELTRQRAVEVALTNNFGLRTAKYVSDVQRENNTWGNAGRYPSLDAAASVRTFGAMPSEGETVSDDSYSLTASLRWTVFQGFAIGANKTRLELLHQQSEQNVEIFVEQSIHNTLLAYDNLLLQRELLQAQREQLLLSQDRLRFVESQNRVGAVSSFEVLQAQNSVYSDSAAAVQQQQFVLQAEDALRSVLALPSDEPLSLVSDLRVPEYTVDQQLLENATATNQFIKQQALQLQLQQEQTTVARSNYYPSLTVNSSFGIDPAQTSFVESSSDPLAYSAGLTLSINLFDGGRTATATQVSKMRENIEEIALDSLKLFVSREVQRAEQILSLQADIVTMRENAFNNSARVLELSDRRFRTGTISIIDLRTIQVQHLNASVEYLRSLYEANRSRLGLLRLTGTLSEMTIE